MLLMKGMDIVIWVIVASLVLIAIYALLRGVV